MEQKKEQINKKVEIYCKNPKCFNQYLATHKIKEKESLSENLMYQMGDEELDDENMVIHQTNIKRFIKWVETEIILKSPKSRQNLIKLRNRVGDKLTLSNVRVNTKENKR